VLILPGEKASFATEISTLANFKDVKVFGQTDSAYPSLYTNSRKNLNRVEGDFILGKSNNKILFSRTYFVTGVPRKKGFES
jgi:hypothetical protein